MSNQELEDMLSRNPALMDLWAKVFGSTPAYSYWTSDSGRKLFCYNTEPLTPSETTKNKKWSAWVMTGGKKNGWKRTKTLYFSKRKTAKARALKWLKASRKVSAEVVCI